MWKHFQEFFAKLSSGAPVVRRLLESQPPPITIMNPTNSEFLLLFRSGHWDSALSPADLQTTMAAFLAWFERLSAEGTLKAGQPLMDDARIVSGKDGRHVADGPFTESKEAVGGYFLIEAANLDAAVAIAQQCPTLAHGGFVEVRPIAAVCPTHQRAERRLAEELATAGA